MLSKLLTAETVFHTLSVAIVVHAMIYGGSIRDAVMNAGIISILGRVTPTEILDKVLAIPLDGKKSD